MDPLSVNNNPNNLNNSGTGADIKKITDANNKAIGGLFGAFAKDIEDISQKIADNLSANAHALYADKIKNTAEKVSNEVMTDFGKHVNEALNESKDTEETKDKSEKKDTKEKHYSALPWKDIKSTKEMKKCADNAEKTAKARNTVGSCYEFAANAIDASYGKFLTGYSAFEAIDQLKNRPDFKEYILHERDYYMLKNLPAGAIVVWERSSEHPHGHISIALGDGREASDHIANQLTNYGTKPHVFIPTEAIG